MTGLGSPYRPGPRRPCQRVSGGHVQQARQSTSSSPEDTQLAGSASRRVLLTSLDDERLAFPLEDVVEVLPAMASTPLPHAPVVIAGVVDLRGRPLPLLDLRARLGRSPADPDPDDHVVVCRIRDRQVGIWVDRALSVTSIDTGDMVAVSEVAQASHVEGVALVPDGMLFVYDVQSFLDADEALTLDGAMQEPGDGAVR